MTSEGDNRAPFTEQHDDRTEVSTALVEIQTPDQQTQSERDALEQKLDEAIEMTFPASDPLAI